MNDRDLERIKYEHRMTKLIEEKIQRLLCPVCGKVTHSTTEEKYVDNIDLHGGIYWGGNEDIPVWQCEQGHAVHIAIIGGIK